MSKQVWGTFSVKDHCDPGAFVAEVMLYDRLVIPIPPNEAERVRWEKVGWDPKRLDRLLKILDKRAYLVSWDEGRKERWKTRYEAGADIAQQSGDWAFRATRTVLTEGLPRSVTGIQVVTNYASIQDLNKELGLEPAVEGSIPLYGGTAITILGHEFFVPEDPRLTHEDLLKQAVDLSSDRTSQRKRAAFWRWQREFLDDKCFTDQSAIKDAVEEMHDLLEEEKAAILKQNVLTGVRYAFLTGSIVLGMLGSPLTPYAVGGAFVSVGQFVADRLMAGDPNAADKPVSLVHDIRKHFGWR